MNKIFLIFTLLLSFNSFAKCTGSGFTSIETNLRKELEKKIQNYIYGDGDSPLFQVKSAQIGAAEGQEDGYYYPVNLQLHKYKVPNSPTINAWGVFVYDQNCTFKKAILGQESFKITPKHL
jgi:hypothetical protein